jgi:FdhE protein
MTNAWQKRIHRAQELVERHPSVAEILRFYIQIAHFQEDLYVFLTEEVGSGMPLAFGQTLEPSELSELISRFPLFLSVVESHGPEPLTKRGRDLRQRGAQSWSDLLTSCWSSLSVSQAQEFVARAFLQPYAELVRSQSSSRPANSAHALCPFCGRKPGLGVLRPQGDGASRSLICSFCLAEWEFRRIVCPGCGEEDNSKLPVYTASEFDCIRVECCDTCKTYIKTVDLSKNGLAEPIVDEIASVSLDLWAQSRGYAKLQLNMMGM